MNAGNVNIKSIEAAARRLAGQATVTPLIENHALNGRVRGRVLIKPECLQRTGSFKFRGAYNRMSQIAPERARQGVVAFSSGNHAQGVAAAAQVLNMSAAIVMPADAPRIKIDNTRGFGAEVVLYDRYREDRHAVACRLADQREAVLVPPFDDPEIIAGQGTIGLEIVAQAAALDAKPDIVLVPCGGGGLVAGIASAIHPSWPDARIHAVEPAFFDDTARSLAAHRRLSNAPGAKSICDALLVDAPGELTFAINDRLLTGGIAVDDRDVAAAVGYAFNVLKLVVEPGGAVALAALLAGKIDLSGRVGVIVLSGGNIDPALFCQLTKPGQTKIASDRINPKRES